MDSGLKYSESDFSLSKENLNTAAGYMKETLSSASQAKGTIPSDFSMASSVSSTISEIEDTCSKNGDLSDTFNNWQTVISAAGTEAINGADSLSVAECIKQIGTHIGAYQSMFGVGLTTNFHLGYNFIPGPAGKHVGGYVIYIPKTYDGKTPVGLSLIFHDSSIHSGITAGVYGADSHPLAQRLKNGEYDTNSIVIFPCASGKANGEGTFADENVQSWILELMDNVITNYNVDKNNISVSSSSSGIRGAVEFAAKNKDYISKVYLAGTLNVYDVAGQYLGNSNYNSKVAIDKVKELSDAGVEVNIYFDKDISSTIYNGYKNVKWHNGSEHYAGGGDLFDSIEFVNQLGNNSGKAVTTIAQPQNGNEGVVTVDNNSVTAGSQTTNLGLSSTTTSPTMGTSSSSSAYVTGAASAAVATTASVTSSSQSNSTNTPVTSYSGSSGSSGHSSSSSGSGGHNSSVSSSTLIVTTPVVETLPNILPENAYSTYIPELKMGKVGLMEISDNGVHYEINEVSDSAFSSYINNLQNSGYILSGDGTVWMKDGNSILLTRNNDIMNIMFNMK